MGVKKNPFLDEFDGWWFSILGSFLKFGIFRGRLRFPDAEVHGIGMGRAQKSGTGSLLPYSHNFQVAKTDSPRTHQTKKWLTPTQARPTPPILKIRKNDQILYFHLKNLIFKLVLIKSLFFKISFLYLGILKAYFSFWALCKR